MPDLLLLHPDPLVAVLGHSLISSQALEISNPSSAYSLTLTTHHSKSSLPLRGRLTLPLDARRTPDLILVFAESSSPSAISAQSAGAHVVGGEELFPKVLSGEISPTKVLATPSMMGAVSRALARYLGPKGLMPSPKRGGVGEGEELGKRVKEAGGSMEWKADKLGVIRARMSSSSSSSIDCQADDLAVARVCLFDLPYIPHSVFSWIRREHRADWTWLTLADDFRPPLRPDERTSLHLCREGTSSCIKCCGTIKLFFVQGKET